MKSALSSLMKKWQHGIRKWPGTFRSLTARADGGSTQHCGEKSFNGDFLPQQLTDQFNGGDPIVQRFTMGQVINTHVSRKFRTHINQPEVVIPGHRKL